MSDEEHVYKPHTFGLGFRITEEMQEDGTADIMDEVFSHLAAESVTWMDIRMSVGAECGLSHDQAKLLLSAYDSVREQLRTLQSQKPPPTVIHTIRRWLADKIAPPREEEDYDD